MTATTRITRALGSAARSTTRRGALEVGAALALAPAGAAAALTAGGQGRGTLVSLHVPEDLAAQLRGRLLWQDEAVAAVAGALSRWRAQPSDSQRPAPAFLFLGPQGVGKTMLAQGMAQHLFGSASAIAHLDAGRMGENALAQLAAAVRGRPEQVLLVDAVDQAKPGAVQALRQLLATGTIGSGQEMVDLRQSVVVLATTAEASALAPELRRRIDQVVTFNPLSQAQLAHIRTLRERAGRSG